MHILYRDENSDFVKLSLNIGGPLAGQGASLSSVSDRSEQSLFRIQGALLTIQAFSDHD